MRIAVVFDDRCQPKKCSAECHDYCPPVRNGIECVTFEGSRGKARISEELCIGCGICIHKCPFDAIRIIGLPDELQQDLVQQFGENGFRLFRLPTPSTGKVIGLLGANGMGKSTIFQILAGQMIPNLGEEPPRAGEDEEEEEDEDEDEAPPTPPPPPTWPPVLARYAGTELHTYLTRLATEGVVTALKPQYVDKIPAVHQGKVRALLSGIDTVGRLDAVAAEMDIASCLDSDIKEISGGELQRVAIAATLLKEADIYLFDEPSSYLDIHQRLRVARSIQRLAEVKMVMVIEHDLAVLDFLADDVFLLFGEEGSYGCVAQPRPVRTAINTYIQGYAREENIRFRDRPIVFAPKPPREERTARTLITYPALRKRFTGFELSIGAGRLLHGQVVGVLGPNATGKTTFVKMLAGVVPPDEGVLESGLRVSYKPQYIKPDFGGTVEELLFSTLGNTVNDTFYQAEVHHPLRIEPLKGKPVTGLSGGELQRLAIALCLAREADLYLIDEPSAYLDVNQRMEAARTIRRVMEKQGRSGLIVDHDVYFIDLVSDSLMVFSGVPSRSGNAAGPFELREGMNRFLKDLDITFRRDADTNRPRINKAGSRLDREQKTKGEYYYASA